MCTAIVAADGEPLAAGRIRTNGDRRFERTFLTVRGAAPRL
jgi:hypothetical protein